MITDKEVGKLLILDMEMHDNMLTFWLGDDEDFSNSWGDDWNDTPFNGNAGRVLNEHVKKIITLKFPLYDDVQIVKLFDDPKGEYSMKDLKDQKHWALKIGVLEFYLGSSFENIPLAMMINDIEFLEVDAEW